MKKTENIIVVIDTDAYAGNFEREMCAYITGQIGDCCVGDKKAALAAEELAEVTIFNGEEQEPILEYFEYSVEHEGDEHGCYRPVQIWDDLDNGYKSLAIFFNEIPPDEVLAIMLERAKEFAATYRSYSGAEITPFQVYAIRVLEPKMTYVVNQVKEIKA